MDEVTVTLRFRNKEARDHFMGGLCDGWGENECQLDWHGKFFDTQEFWVSPFDNRRDASEDEGEEDLKWHWCKEDSAAPRDAPTSSPELASLAARLLRRPETATAAEVERLAGCVLAQAEKGGEE